MAREIEDGPSIMGRMTSRPPLRSCLKIVTRGYPSVAFGFECIDIGPCLDRPAVVQDDGYDLPLKFMRQRIAGATSFVGVERRQHRGWIMQAIDLADDPRSVG